ncbi:Septin 4 [Clydaea vesicula]|uniref:Septin 4 n=1 Tax=Clydaea vesicula TaxID=447962 RepID=A0AAD5U6K9_9FUNG|nr:Septin 4 [Clydaea vesicula]KAJ3394782.1 Septin 4 [Lobulomyces angularis]
MPLEYALQFRGKFPDPGPWKLPRSFSARPSQPLGISDLPVQRLRRSKNKPYFFNIMVVGESGLGKTTFMNTLFNTNLNDDVKGHPKNLSDSGKTLSINPTTYELSEEGVTLHLTVIDTPGFGDSLNRESNFQPIMDYIDNQYDSYLQAERSQEMRRNIKDNRVHALLYFIAPNPGNNDGLKELDSEFLIKLSMKVNVIPVIAKADSLTTEEISLYKRGILKDFEKNDIRVYPTFHAEDRENTEVEKYMPFSVIGSDDFVESNGSRVRGRKYRWGQVEVENPEHCDFVLLRDLLIRTNLQDLIDTTHSTHYAQYRSSRIRSKGRPESFLACDEYYDSRIENAKKSLTEEMQRKEDEMRQMFVSKVREKEASLREREEMLNEKRKGMMEELEKLRRSVEDEEAAINQLQAQRTVKR